MMSPGLHRGGGWEGWGRGEREGGGGRGRGAEREERGRGRGGGWRWYEGGQVEEGAKHKNILYGHEGTLIVMVGPSQSVTCIAHVLPSSCPHSNKLSVHGE